MLNVVQTDMWDKLVYVALYPGFGRKINVHLNDNRNLKVLRKWYKTGPSDISLQNHKNAYLHGHCTHDVLHCDMNVIS